MSASLQVPMTVRLTKLPFKNCSEVVYTDDLLVELTQGISAYQKQLVQWVTRVHPAKLKI